MEGPQSVERIWAGYEKGTIYTSTHRHTPLSWHSLTNLYNTTDGTI